MSYCACSLLFLHVVVASTHLINGKDCLLVCDHLLLLLTQAAAAIRRFKPLFDRVLVEKVAVETVCFIKLVQWFISLYRRLRLGYYYLRKLKDQ